MKNKKIEKCDSRGGTGGDKCTGPVDKEHPCPYEEDINNNPDDVCKCCALCAQECANDI